MRAPMRDTTAPPPVEFTFLGLADDGIDVRYQMKVGAAGVRQVDFAIRYFAADGAVVRETTVAWQNVVMSERRPIEPGHTYPATHPLAPGAVRCDTHLVMVHFSDGTKWTP